MLDVTIFSPADTALKTKTRGCPGVPVHEGIPIVFISIHGVVTQFVNVSFLCVPVHEDTTKNKEKIRSGFLGEVNAEPVVEKHLVQAYPSSLSVFPPESSN